MSLEERVSDLERQVADLVEIIAQLLAPRAPTLRERHEAFVKRLRGEK